MTRRHLQTAERALQPLLSLSATAGSGRPCATKGSVPVDVA
jgi:hypothetical protein